MSIDGIVRRDPTESEDERMTDAATALLQRRLEGEPHRSAVLFVCASHSLSRGEVHRSWLEKRRDALAALTMGRVMDACPWTDAEIRRLSRIFAGKLGSAATGGTDQGATAP
jgi:hypothetical protein